MISPSSPTSASAPTSPVNQAPAAPAAVSRVEVRPVAISNAPDAPGRVLPGGRVPVGDANVRNELRTHRAAFALPYALGWLYRERPGGVPRDELLEAAAMLAACVKEKKPPGDQEARPWQTWYHDMGANEPVDQQSVKLVHSVGALLRNDRVIERVNIARAPLRHRIRIGTIAAYFLRFKPFDERAECMAGDQVVPDATASDSIARKAIEAILTCATPEDLKVRVSELRSWHTTDPDLANTIRAVQRFVDDEWPPAVR